MAGEKWTTKEGRVVQEYGAVLSALRGWGNVRPTEGGWLARCPVHDDRQGSLLVLAAGDGRVELDCLGGDCDPQDVAAALRLGPENVVVAPPAFEDGPGWLWPGYVPAAGVTVIDAEDGTSALAVALDVAARIAQGGTLPDGQQQHRQARTVLALASPQNAQRMTELLTVSGPGADRIEVAEVLGGRGGQRGIRLPGDADRLEQLLRERAPDLVVLDLMSLCPYRMPVGRALRSLADVAARLGTAVLAVREASKRAGWMAAYRAQEAAQPAMAAAVHLVVAGADGALALVPVHTRHWTVMGGLQFQAPGHRPVVWNSRFPHGSGQALAWADVRRRRPASTNARDLLCSLLAAGPVPTREVLAAAVAAGLAPRTVQRARQQLGVVASKTARGWVLSLPDRGPSGGGAPVGDQ